jgi:hypothetical protein
MQNAIRSRHHLLQIRRGSHARSPPRLRGRNHLKLDGRRTPARLERSRREGCPTTVGSGRGDGACRQQDAGEKLPHRAPDAPRATRPAATDFTMKSEQKEEEKHEAAMYQHQHQDEEEEAAAALCSPLASTAGRDTNHQAAATATPSSYATTTRQGRSRQAHSHARSWLLDPLFRLPK